MQWYRVRGREEKIMEDLKLDVKLWLKANRRDYAWLAQRCYVTETTVRNWMAKKPIPKAKAHIIRELISQSPVMMPSMPPIDVTLQTHVMIRLDKDVTKRLEDKAFAQGLTLEEFLSRTLANLSAK